MNDDYNKKLIYAISIGNLEKAQEELNKGADINYKNEISNTPLFYAVFGGNIKTVKFLLEKGADINYQNKHKTSALFRAIIFNHVDIVKFLLENGANKNLIDAYGETALTKARKFKESVNKNSEDYSRYSKIVDILEGDKTISLENWLEQGDELLKGDYNYLKYAILEAVNRNQWDAVKYMAEILIKAGVK